MTDHELAIALVEAGSAVVRHRFATALKHTSKGQNDFATDADFESERAMLDLLARLRPDDAVLAEESGRSGRHSSTRVWLLDPLCGTLNYAAGTRLVAVNAALQEQDGLTVAAVADPFSSEIFWTDGQSALLRSNGHDTPLAPTGRSNIVELDIDSPSPNSPSFRVADLAADPEFISQFEPRVLSTSLALTWVASGQRAAYISDGEIHENVHYAAGVAICQAAACKVTDLWGRPCGNGETGLIAAADAHTHRTIVQLIAKRLS